MPSIPSSPDPSEQFAALTGEFEDLSALCLKGQRHGLTPQQQTELAMNALAMTRRTAQRLEGLIRNLKRP